MFRRSAQREPLKLKGFRHPHTTWFDRKAEASFAHSKRCREVRLPLQTLRLRHGPRCHDARSVWSARSLLPLFDETTRTVRRAIHSPQLKSTKSEMLPIASQLRESHCEASSSRINNVHACSP